MYNYCRVILLISELFRFLVFRGINDSSKFTKTGNE